MGAFSYDRGLDRNALRRNARGVINRAIIHTVAVSFIPRFLPIRFSGPRSHGPPDTGF